MYIKKILSKSLYVVALVVLLPAISSAAMFFISDSGYFGFGNSNPLHKIDVSGAIYSRLVSTSSSTIDWNDGNVQSIDLTGNKTLSFTNGRAGGEYKLILNQDSTGGRTITWPASVVWADATTPTLTTTASSTDVISFVNGGNGYLGSYILNYATNPLYDNLISYWDLSTNSNDAAGSNDGSDTSMSYSSGDGKVGNGAGFNGSTSKINLSNPSNLQLTSTFSIAFWVKLASTAPGGAYALVTKTDDSSQRSYGIWYNNPSGGQGLNFQMSSNGSNPNTYEWNANSGTANPGDTNWHHYVFTFNSNGGSPSITVYKDGTNVTTQNGASQSSQSWSGTSIYNSSSNVVIGNKTNGSWPFSGSMDEVGIWSRVLSSGDVSTLYNSGSGRAYPF